jgi:alpha-1,3-rhamnosyl/mannosyltransferase
VSLIGYVPDDALVALIGRAGAVAYPSRYEGFGLPVLEALACGAVVVAADRTSIPEVAGDAAILVDPGSDDAMADGLLRALIDGTLRAGLAEAGPTRAAMFDWDRCAAATVVGYRRALES